MAETLVLAELSIDSSGVVSGVAVAGGSLDALGRKTQETGKKVATAAGPLDVLTRRMFSLRSAAVALLGGFTLAGVIFQVVNLAKELITGTDAWKRWSEAATDAFNAVVRGEQAIERIGRKLGEAAKGTGVVPGLVNQENVTKLLELRAKTESELAALPAGFGFGASPKDLLARKVLQTDLENITRALFKMQEQSGLSQRQFDLLFGTNLANAIVEATRLDDGFNDALRRTTDVIERAIRLTGDWEVEMNRLGNTLRDTWTDMEPLFVGMEQAWATAADELARIRETDIGEIFNAIGESLERVNPAFEKAQIRVQELIAAYGEFGIVASAAFEAVSAAAAAGVISQSAAARIQLAILAIESVMKGKIEVAEAVAAAARYDFASATLHGIAAGLYFAAAAFYGKGAIFGQAGAAGGGGGGGFGGGAPAAPQPQRVIYVTNNFGMTFGFNEAGFARYIKDLERRGERNNT